MDASRRNSTARLAAAVLSAACFFAIPAGTGASPEGARSSDLSPGPPAGRGKAFRKGRVEAPASPGGPARNRARWAQLSPERRRELRRLYEQLLERLSAEERRLLIEKLSDLDPKTRQKVLAEARKRVLEDPLEREAARLRKKILEEKLKALPAAERDLLGKMAPAERVRYLAQGAAARRRMLLDRLPPGERTRVAALPPGEQVRELWRLLAEETLRKTFEDPREVEALRRLPAAKLAELCRSPKDGPPPKRPAQISETSWELWLALKPYERTRCVRLFLGIERPKAAPSSKPQK